MQQHLFKVIAASALLASTPVWAIFKCTGPTGAVTYQEAPCSNTTNEQRINPTANGAGTANTSERLTQIQRDKAVFEAKLNNEPLVGMTLKELNDAMGKPTKVNPSNIQGHISEQRVFNDKRGDLWYVYTSNGAVDSIQHLPGQAQHPVVREAKKECTSLQKSNLEAKASSFTLSPEEKAAIHKRIANGEC